MPKPKRGSQSLVRATFVGGPLDGTSAPSLGHEHIVKATLENNGSVRHWHWYELEIDESGERRYRYVGAEDGGWPKRFGSEG